MLKLCTARSGTIPVVPVPDGARIRGPRRLCGGFRRSRLQDPADHRETVTLPPTWGKTPVSVAAQSACPASKVEHTTVRLPWGVPVASTTGRSTTTGRAPAPVMMPCTVTPAPVLLNCRQFGLVGVGHGPTTTMPPAAGPAGGE